jgi:integrase
MFGWAVEERHMTHNPVRDVRQVKYVRKGFHTWLLSEVCKFAERHPIGTKPFLALCLLLFTGMRTGDMIRLGPQHVHGDWITFVPRKSRHIRNEESAKPLLPPLVAAIKAGPIGKNSFLETQYGRRFSDKGIGNAMRQWCDQAGLPHCTAHGLRKAGATILAEFGATDQQLMAVFDWTTSAQAKVYTEAANRKRMANDAMPLLTHFSRAMDASRTLPEPSFVAPGIPALSHRR